MAFLDRGTAKEGVTDKRRAGPLIWLVALALVRGLIYLSIVPPWQGVDETFHFAYIHLLVDQGSLVRSPSDEMRLTMWQTEEKWHFQDLLLSEQAPQPWPKVGVSWATTIDRFSLAFIPYALVAWPLHDASFEVQLYSMRLVSVMLGAATVVLAFQIARLVAPTQMALAWGTALFVLFLPQHTFILASVNDGNLAELLCGVTIYWLAKMMKTGFDWRWAILSVLSAIAALLCKAIGFFLIPLLGLSLLALTQRYWHRRRWAWSVAGVLVVVTLVGVWLFLRRLAPASAVAQFSLATLQPLVSPAIYASLNAHGQFASALRGTFTSFWANLGWMRLPLPYTWYYGLMLVTAVCLIGFGMSYFRLRRTPVQPGYALMALAAILPVAVLIAQFIAIPGGHTRQHGRLLFGGMVPIAFVLVAGGLHWVPVRLSRWAVWGMVGGLAALDTAVWWNLAIPFFYR